MEERRISVFGRDSNDQEKRAFDLVKINGQTFVETVGRNGHRVKTPASEAITAIEQMAQYPA